MKPKPLIVIPNYSTEPQDIGVLTSALQSIRQTAGESADVLVVDDCSPEPMLVDQVEALTGDLNFELHRKDENTGFSRTVNIGLRKALDEGRDAILMNADVELQTPGWIKAFKRTKDRRAQPAAIVGALLLYPNGLIQHAGIYFSLLTRTFDHMYKYGPANLPDALRESITPVTGALQFIRHSCLKKVGLYDEEFRMGWEDVDYCLRTFLEGEQCVYQPRVRAWHYEQMFRGRGSKKVSEWQRGSWTYLANKYSAQDFTDLVPHW